MVNETRTIKFLFGSAQALLACSTIALALALQFGFFDPQVWSISQDALDFYVVVLLGVGVVLLIGGLFVLYDSWESLR
ncbi:MAG: hypothetical protein NWF04_09775 [Candidatus Bathyarchaeota archaeon]|nr:hypothetical protein [Candidatus Bathyarchaeota archaeon]